MQTFIALLALVAVAAASDPYHPSPSYHEPTYHEPSYHEPSYHSSPSYHEPAYKDTPPKYKYAYGVDAQDDYKGYVQFGAEEARDGYSTYGSYHVLLPDGRTQHVTYKTEDAYSGNVVDVKYDGKASYHEPAHKAPTYHA